MKKVIAMLVATMMLGTSFGMATSAFAEEATTELNIAVGAQFTTLDPALSNETINGYAISHMYKGLFDTNENNEVVNALCDTYEVSDDGLTYTFHIVKDAVWSDGVGITANDFVYGMLRALSFGADNIYTLNNMTSYIAGAEDYNAKALEMGAEFNCDTEDYSTVGIAALDDYTLQLTLRKPCAFFPRMLAGGIWFPMREDFAPQHESLWAFEGGYPTNGTYTLQECNENEKAVLVKNPAYSKADEVLVDTINFMVMTDASAQALAFQTGEVDIAMSVSTDTAMTYEGTDNLWLMPSASVYFLAINSGETGPEWAKDVNARRALALSIDKDTLIDVLGGTTMYTALNGYVPSGLQGVSGDFREEGDADGYTLTYDLEQAKTLLAEAGYSDSNPLTISYKYSNNGIHGDVATMLQQMWQMAGINVSFESVESGVFYDQLDQGDFEVARYGYSSSSDPITYLQIWTTSNQVVAAVDDAAYDKMIDDAAFITDPAAYYTELHKIEDYLVDENVYIIPLFNYNTSALVQSNLSGYTQHGGSAYFAEVVK